MLNKIYNKHKETISNFFWRSLQIFGKQGIVFLIFILSAKLLSPYDFGIYNYLLTIIYFVIIFSDFGISQSTSKYIAEYDTKDPSKVNVILFNSLFIIFLLSIISSIVFIIIAYFFFYKYVNYLWYLLPLIFLVPAVSVYDGVYRGLKQFKKLSIVTTLIGLISIIYVYFLIKYYGIMGALVSQIIFYLTLFFGLIIGYKEKFSFRIDVYILKKVSHYGIVIGLGSIGYFLYSRIDIVILGHFGYIKEIGYYEIVNKFFDLLKIPFLIFATVISPYITNSYTNGNIIEIKNKFSKHLIIFFLVSIIFAVILYFVLPFILYFVKFKDSIFILQIFNLLLLIFPVIVVWTITDVGYIFPTGNADIILYINFMMGILNIILDLLFIYHFGFVGVIYATILCFTLGTLLYILFFYKRLKNKLTK